MVLYDNRVSQILQIYEMKVLAVNQSVVSKCGSP